MTVARSFSGGVVIRYILSVLWMTSYLLIIQVDVAAQLGLATNGAVIPVAVKRSHRTTFRALKVTSQLAAPGRSLRTMTALFTVK